VIAKPFGWTDSPSKEHYSPSQLDLNNPYVQRRPRFERDDVPYNMMITMMIIAR
jgi:hypothetical protein